MVSDRLRFYVGLHQPADAEHFPRCMVSVNRLRARRSPFPASEWMMDSGAFTELDRHHGYRHGPAEYAEEVNRWAAVGQLVAATSQDYMCEPFILAKTGLSIADHQRLTIERYDAIRALVTPGIHVLPVLQGWTPADYASHARQYGDRLTPGMWVGVGSVCKRNTDPALIQVVLRAIKAARPDLRLHGFGVKLTALRSAGVRALIYSADSMAWSYSARKQGRNGNDWREATAFVERVRRAEPELREQMADLPLFGQAA